MGPYRTSARPKDAEPEPSKPYMKPAPEYKPYVDETLSLIRRLFADLILCADSMSGIVAGPHDGYGGYRLHLNSGAVLDVRDADVRRMNDVQLVRHIRDRIWQIKDAEDAEDAAAEEAARAAIPEVRGFRIGTRSPKRNKR